MVGIVYEYQIPDPDRPISEDARGVCGPTGALVPFTPMPATRDEVAGRTVDELSTCVGTHGMGGPGFFGLRLGSEWLVVAIWGAAAWMRAQDRLVEDHFYEKHGRPKPWISDAEDALSRGVVGTVIEALEVTRDALSISCSSGLEFVVAPSPDTRPVFEGSGEPRAFAAEDDLRRAVFLAPTDEIWV